ncbi:MAG TPA: hypothetical protein VH740_00170 [Vicinamibacterales bacterium]|jgi:hypothetical protein
MAHRKILTTAALLVVLVTAVASGQKSPTPDAQLAAFVGTWAFTMTEPEALKGSQQTIRVSQKNGVIGASVQIGKFPAIEATGIFKDGEMLVFTISHQAGMRENGAPIWAVISLIMDGDTMRTAQMLEKSQTIKRGVGKRVPD